MNVSAFKETLLYMFVHVNDVFLYLYVCISTYKTPELQQSGVFSMSVYLIV
ncbi:Uncharacterised protein [Bacillus tequilensis]|nr:Uncharacterised protein [Bacillus tequilensis]